MRSMLYAGAALMIGACIYGFVDYKKTSHKKEFSGMYKENKAVAKTEPGSKEISTAPETKKAEGIKGEGEKVKADNKTAEVKKEVKRKRNFRISEFSRAPLRDEEEKVVLDEQDTRKPDTTSTIEHKKDK